jgi:alpha-mannosidase
MSSSVVVADWIDPTDNPLENQVLQPILLASRKSCHWEGNEYLQTGNHYFKFSVTSHQPGKLNGAAFGRQANEELKAVLADRQFTTASLPESLSFFNVDKDNVLVSTLKKAEDSDDVVLRITDLEGKDKILTIESYKKAGEAKLTNLIEEEKETLKSDNKGVKLNLGHHAIETVRIKF